MSHREPEIRRGPNNIGGQQSKPQSSDSGKPQQGGRNNPQKPGSGKQQ